MSKVRKLEPKLDAEVKGLGRVYRVFGPFDEGVEALGDMEFISARDLVCAIVDVARKTKRWQYNGFLEVGCFVREGVVYVQGEGIVLVRESPVLESPERTRNLVDEEFEIDRKRGGEFLERARDERDDSAILLKGTEEIHSDKLSEDERAVWLFGDQVDDLGEVLMRRGVYRIPLHFYCQEFVDEHNGPIANQVFVDSLKSKLSISGMNKEYYYGKVRGLSREVVL